MKIQVNNSVGLNHRDNTKLLNEAIRKGIIAVDNSTHFIGGVSSVAPLGALNYIRPEAIEILTAPLEADAIATAQKNGNWGDESVTIKLKQFSGSTSPDDGTPDDGKNSTANYNTTARGVYYYRADWKSSDRDEASVGTAFKENYRADQAKAAMTSLNIDRNSFFFSGIKLKNSPLAVYGFLNEPSLGAYKTVPAVNSKRKWEEKEPQDIVNDVVLAFQDITSKSNGLNNKFGGKYKLNIATDSIGYIDRANSYGVTARKLLKEMYGDKLEIIAVPQLSKADSNSDVFYLVFESTIAPTVINSYVELARAYPLFQKHSEVSQKISAGTSGCVVQYSMFITRYNGIG
ncbi:MAG: hypothetical protein ACK5N8_06805 [Alphaproteobacteria bacterium]